MAEPIKLTQAQALFAVLAGAAQSRRERVYFRDEALRSTLYSPIDGGNDEAFSDAQIVVSVMHITLVDLCASDTVSNAAGILAAVSVAAKPESKDDVSNSASLTVKILTSRKTTVQDGASNAASLTLIKYTSVKGGVSDGATNTAVIGVTKI